MSDPLDPVAIGREVLEREAQALLQVRDRIDASFTQAVELLESAHRIVVTGIGKSGSVGAKIAATLTSTGSPATYLHPTEALHGDLGIVGAKDTVLALSKSGRSAELVTLIPHIRRMGATVIAVVEDATSPLAQHADVVLALGRIEEACSLDLVPTSSTTATMALGDALAVALFRRRGLTAEDFAFVHPGGLIGRTLSRRVSEIMHAGAKLPRTPGDATLRAALVEIVDKGLGMTTIVHADETLAGILTDGDLKRILLGPDGDHALAEPVARYMTRTPRTITPDSVVATAVRVMELGSPVTCLVVVEDRTPVGVLHLHDCLRSDAS